MSPSMRARTLLGCWCAGLAIWLLLGVLALRGVPVIVDEVVHAAQVQRYHDGLWQQHPALSTFPTWHLLVAALSTPWASDAGSPDIDALRLVALLLALPLLPIGYLLARRTVGLPAEQAAMRTFMLALLPGIAPLLFLLYTDALATLLVLATLLAASRERHRAAFALALGATMVRQSAVVWIAWAGWQRWRTTEGDRWARCRASLPHALALGAFLAFVLVNHGVALGDRDAHALRRLYLENVEFALLFGWLVLLPVQIAALPRIAGRLRDARMLLAAGLVALLFFGWFAPEHRYNQIYPDGILHNGAIALLRAPLPRALAALALAWSFLTVLTTPLRGIERTPFLLAGMLGMAPSMLVEPRYALPTIAGFLLLRASESRRTEWLLALWLALLGAWLGSRYATYTMVL